MSQTIDNIKQEILSKLNLQAEFESFGIKLIDKPSPKGWIKCPSPFAPEKRPSCGVCVDNSSSYAGHLHVFNNSSLHQTHNLFDLAYDLSPICSGRDFMDILKFYADKTGVEFDFKSKKKSTEPKGKIITTYDYCDLSGKLIYQVCRLKPKSFRQRRPDSKNPEKWIWNMDGITALPYHIKNVIDNKTVYIVEGEKCADDLIDKFKLPATTFHGGSGKYYPEILPYFKDKNIILLPDNDAPGKEHMERLAHVFVKTAASIKIVELPNLEPKGDISNWIASGGTKEKLLDLCKKTLVYEATEDPIDELNKRHAVTIIGGKVRILDEKLDAYGKIFSQDISKYDFHSLYENKKIPNPLAGQKGQPKFIQLSQAWLNSPVRREYDGQIFAPKGIKNSRYYNLYKGLAIEPIKGDWSLLREHIHNIICNKNLQRFCWLEAWMARIVQDPGGEKPGTAVVLRGEKGVGKGIFVEAFAKIFGINYRLITKASQAIGRFNSTLECCILLFLDEAFFAGDKSSDGVLKSLITSDHFEIEPKGKESYQAPNHVNCIIASNNKWTVSAGKNERRYFALKVSDRKRKKYDYFAAIRDQMEMQGGTEAMLYDLLKLDISEFNLRAAPKTAELAEQIINGFSPPEKFWFDLLKSNFEIDKMDGFTKPEFYEIYRKYCDDKKYNDYRLTNVALGKKLKEYSNVDITGRGKTDIVTGVRPWLYRFDDKNILKKRFEQLYDIEFDWWNNGKSEVDLI